MFQGGQKGTLNTYSQNYIVPIAKYARQPQRVIRRRMYQHQAKALRLYLIQTGLWSWLEQDGYTRRSSRHVFISGCRHHRRLRLARDALRVKDQSSTQQYTTTLRAADLDGSCVEISNGRAEYSCLDQLYRWTEVICFARFPYRIPRTCYSSLHSNTRLLAET